jgi:TolB-like protein/tetratricopeptide (TPR) repeat protein/DNA-binding winged helix-turn-helix (wHTH) protein
MVATDLQGGFRLGEWLVEPQEARVTGRSGRHSLTPDQLALLTELARRHGELQTRRDLRERVWPGESGTDARLRDTVRTLRALLGGSAQDQRYIANVGRTGLILVAHFEPHERTPPVVPGPEQSPQESAPSPDASRVISFQSLFAELRRRKVIRATGAYLVGMWLVLQVAETTFEPLHLPEWWLTALTILAVVGLPIVAVLAWAYEVTPQGLMLDRGHGRALRLVRKRVAIAPVVVAGVALMAIVTGYAWWLSIDRTGSADAGDFDPSPQSIAVLPFADMSPSGQSAYLGDGLSEELSSDLAKLPGLRVAARTSSFAFKGVDVDIREIGRALGVRYVLEGSVRREGDRVRVTAQLIDAKSGFHAWTESYDRPWEDLISIQQGISGAIARQLQTVLTPEEAKQLKGSTTLNPRAYDFYLAGLSRLRQGGSLSSIDEAEDLFRRSLEEDPNFARAQAGLCQVAIARYERTGATDQVQIAETNCRKALEGDPTLKETELALGRLYVASGRYEQAEALYRSLLRRAPRDADVHIGLGRTLARLQRPEEAEQSFREAIAVEPGYWLSYNALGGFLFESGRSREAAEAYQRVTKLAPSNPTGYNNLGAALLFAGDLEASARAFEKSKSIEPSRAAYSNLGTLYYYMGRFDDAVVMYSKAIELAPEDYRLWGGRGDANWYRPDGRAAARADYTRATLMAEKALAVNAADADAWAQLGYYYGRLGEGDRAKRYVARALELGPDAPFVLYIAALAAADRGDTAEATRLINLAIQNGYAKSLARPDPALKGIPIA